MLNTNLSFGLNLVRETSGNADSYYWNSLSKENKAGIERVAGMIEGIKQAPDPLEPDIVFTPRDSHCRLQGKPETFNLELKLPYHDDSTFDNGVVEISATTLKNQNASETAKTILEGVKKLVQNAKEPDQEKPYYSEGLRERVLNLTV